MLGGSRRLEFVDSVDKMMSVTSHCCRVYISPLISVAGWLDKSADLGEDLTMRWNLSTLVSRLSWLTCELVVLVRPFTVYIDYQRPVLLYIGKTRWYFGILREQASYYRRALSGQENVHHSASKELYREHTSALLQEPLGVDCFVPVLG